jgi:hypothetical protein
LNHSDRRGSWAAKWGQAGSRYHRATQRGLSGVAPVRSWARRLKGVQRIDDFAAVPYRLMSASHRWRPQSVDWLHRARLVMGSGRSGDRWKGVGPLAGARSRRRLLGRDQVAHAHARRQPWSAMLGHRDGQISLRRLTARPAWHRRAQSYAHAAIAGIAARTPVGGTRHAVAPVRRRDTAETVGTIFPARSPAARHSVALSAGQDRPMSPRVGTDHPEATRMMRRQPDSFAMPVDHGFSAGGRGGSLQPGRDMMLWFGRVFGDEARRPPSGPTRPDTMLSPIFPGRKPGF